MTMRYAHLAPDHMKRAVEILDRADREDRDVPVEILDGPYLDTERKMGLDNTVRTGVL
jgi:hypothetical protein